MGTLPTPVRLDVAATGNAADGQIHRNVVDDAFGAMASKLLIFLRAETINVASAGIVDALGNPVTAKTTATKTAGDPNFNGHTSITWPSGGTNNPYIMTPGGIGVGTAPQPMTNSFTILTGMRAAPSTSGQISAFFGDNAGTSDGADVTGFYSDTNGVLHWAIGSSTGSSPAGLIPPATTGVFWVSFDATTSILRAGLNTTVSPYEVTAAATRNGASSTTVVRPQGYETSGGPTEMGFHRWALFNKAYMNGAVPGDDAQFTALINAYNTYI